jgi:CRISPR system Cascade subunit CasC
MARAPNVFVEFHALTSHSPSNLNRDELGTPKSAVFGGTRRLRLSSQCLKRTWRTSEYFRGEFADEELGVRTSHLPAIVLEALGEELAEPVREGLVALLTAIGTGDSGRAKAEQEDSEEEEAEEGDAVAPVVDAAEAETRHLLFLSRQEIAAVKEFALSHREELGALFEAPSAKGKAAAKKVLSKAKLEKARKLLAAHMRERCKRNAVDVALFGRFVTSEEIQTVDAAMQVAHALGTQKVEIEYDYFSAVDDLATGPGAGHIGESEFASSVFYKYAACDLRLLLKNLDGEAELAAAAMKGLAVAIARAVPIGKKNSTAPQNPADYLEVVVRRDAPVSLANAFLRPASPSRDADVMDESIRLLRQQAVRYDAAYGGEVIARLALPLRKVDLDKSAKPFESLEELTKELQPLVRRLAAELCASPRA